MARKITLGVHIGHDRSVSIVENGALVAHLAEERVDRVKHSRSVAFPRKSLFTLLEFCGLTLADISGFAISYSFVDMSRVAHGLAEDFRAEFGLKANVEILGVDHHLAHALAAFYTSPFDEATILIADGAGDLTKNNGVEAESAFIGTKNGVYPLWCRQQDIPASYSDRRTFFRSSYLPNNDRDKQISIGRKYEQLTYAIGFGWGQSGKTMGLAPYGKALFDVPARALDPIAGFDLRMSDLIDNLEIAQEESGEPFALFVKRHRADIAATIQKGTEDITLAMLRHLYNLNPNPNLCLAGGLFLNCVLNHKILLHTPYRNIHIVPASADDGQSVGTAFFVYNHIFGAPKKAQSASSAYLGPCYSSAKICADLEHVGLKYEVYEEYALLEKIATLLSSGLVCGLLRGRSEMGPRALGHRSILAAPTFPGIRDHLNCYVKHREVFRPFAPMVTWEDQFSYFGLKAPSPFMLFTAPVEERFRSMLPGITHVDGSARIQAVSKEGEPFLHSLLNQMRARSGHPILLNTSFNLVGEPIVETPRDAISTFLRSNLDFLVLENYIVERTRSI